jgi:hypothetical protein
MGYVINRRSNNVRATKEVTEQEKATLEKERAETLVELDRLKEYLRGEVDPDEEEAPGSDTDVGKQTGIY